MTTDLDALTASMDSFTQAMEAASLRMQESVDKSIGAIGESYKKMFRQAKKGWNDSADENVKISSKVYFGFMDTLTGRWKDTMENMVKEAKKNKIDLDLTIGKSFGRSSAEALQDTHQAIKPDAVIGGVSGLAALKGSLLSELPFGGLLGLMLYGKFKEEDFNAAGRQVVNQFQRIGTDTVAASKQHSAQMVGLMKDLETNFVGSRETMIATASALVDAGVDEAGAMQNAKISAEGYGDTILGTSMALDNFFKLGAGSSAKIMGELMRDTGVSAADAQTEILKLGLAARDTGEDFNRFVTSSMQVASNLRLMRVDTLDVAESQLKLQEAMSHMMPGASKQYVSAAAASGIQSAAQGIANLSVGVSAVLGERMSGGKVRGLDAYYAFKEGASGMDNGPEGKKQFSAVVAELGKLAAEQGRTVSEQRKFLENLGIGLEGSRAIVAIHDEIGKTGDSGKATARHMGEFRSSFDKKAAETSSFQRELKEAVMGVQNIGTGILGMITVGYKSILAAITYMTQGMFGDQQKKDDALEDLAKLSGLSDKYNKQIYSGFSSIAGAGKGFYQDVFDIDDEREKTRKARKGKTPEQIAQDRAAAKAEDDEFRQSKDYLQAFEYTNTKSYQEIKDTWRHRKNNEEARRVRDENRRRQTAHDPQEVGEAGELTVKQVRTATKAGGRRETTFVLRVTDPYPSNYVEKVQ